MVPAFEPRKLLTMRPPARMPMMPVKSFQPQAVRSRNRLKRSRMPRISQ
jgi:hypothetical protein